MEARLRADKDYKFDSSLWLHPGSFVTIYKYVDDQKQQYSKRNQDSNQSKSSGSAAKPPPRETVFTLKRARIWDSHKRCKYPRDVIESGGAPAANSPLAETSASAPGTPASGVGTTLDLEEVAVEGVSDDDTSSQRAASEADGDDDDMELRTSQNSPPASRVYGDRDGVGEGGGSSTGGGVSKGKGKAKDKPEEKPTPPRDRGRDGHAKKQLATFQATGLGTLQSQSKDLVTAMGSQFKDVVSMLPSILGRAGGGAAAGSSAPATETGADKTKRQMEVTRMMTQFDQQYNEQRMKDTVEKNLIDLNK